MERQCICKVMSMTAVMEKRFANHDGPKVWVFVSGLTKASNLPWGLILALVNPRTWNFLEEKTTLRLFWELGWNQLYLGLA